MTDLAWITAAEAVSLMTRRKLSPVEYLDALLARAEAQSERLNPFAFVAADRARDEAKQAEAALAKGEDLGPLAGLPMHVKDLFPTAGIPTEYGSATKAGTIPEADDILVTRLREAGSVIFAKSTTPEFGHKGQTDGPHFGTTRNPWDTTRYAGGSSGGAACAVAAGIGPLGLGTDGAGSIRIPAAACGLVGLKPTVGLLPYGEAGEAFGNVAAAGPLARTVEDAALMITALAGADDCDPWSLSAPEPLATRAGRTLHGLRVGYIPKFCNARVSADVEANTKAVLDGLAARGAVIEEVTDPVDWIEYEGRVLYQVNIAMGFGPLVDRWGNQMDPVLLGFIERGRGFTIEDYRKAMLARTRLFRAVQALFTRYDVLISPTVTRTALPADFEALDGQVMVDGHENGLTRQGMSPYCYPFNLTGHPALALPSGFARDGLPTSVQFIGPYHTDLDLLALAATVEEDRPWAHLRPAGLD
ncbi:amidase [Oceanicola sp. 22II-s10i]|uniref:amidase n=1 Tax=Oceanicola sp. 22II-s10i TaxID=1317116 RepID=UPI000B5208FE|nr:amidase family protein [Oceanicola sp. 22II-s10i]OWU86677.1 amidase [Oceanicola sp. 22II-s10i]